MTSLRPAHAGVARRVDASVADIAFRRRSLVATNLSWRSDYLVHSQPLGDWTLGSNLGYTLQSGALKNLNLRWRNSSIRRDYSSNEFDENRLIISYPLSLL
jgi:hypothetical protein